MFNYTNITIALSCMNQAIVYDYFVGAARYKTYIPQNIRSDQKKLGCFIHQLARIYVHLVVRSEKFQY